MVPLRSRFLTLIVALSHPDCRAIPKDRRRYEAAVVRLIGALLLEQNDEWAVQRARYMTLETMTPIAMVRSSICPQWQPDQGTQLSLMQSLLHHVLGLRIPVDREHRFRLIVNAQSSRS
jgi:hypothetical protein